MHSNRGTMSIQSPDDGLVVSFASDIDGNLHMFSQHPSASEWRVYVIDAHKAEHKCDAVNQFIGYWRLAPGELCWDVDDISQAEYIEIHRPGTPPSRTVHPRSSIWKKQDNSADQSNGPLGDWSGPVLTVIDMRSLHKPLA